MNESVNESEFVLEDVDEKIRSERVQCEKMRGIITGQEKNYHASSDVK